MSRSTLRLTGRVLGSGIKLAEVPQDDAPVWIQIARAGTYKGHKVGKFTFDTGFFELLIANFRQHPAYKAGPDGVGIAKVVPYDYEHASEMAPTEGSIPLTGAPAPAWALELEVRGEGNEAELWALTELGEQARQQIRADAYQWTSVAVWKDAVDPVSGEKVGPVLTSIAFTNHPFIQGMAPMAAKVEVWGEAESHEEVIIGLREVLGLGGEADSAAVLNELVDLGVAYNEGRRLPGCPEGVGHLIDRVRRLVGLRALATAEEIIQVAGQALGAAAPSTPAPAAVTPAPPGETTMSESINARLATIYGVKDKDDAILAAAQEGEKAKDALAKLKELFGSTDTQSIIAEATKTIAEAEKVKDLVAALEAANARLAEGDKAEAEEEVEAVAASMGLKGDSGNRIKSLLLRERMACAGDPQRLEEFRRQYPVQTPQRLALTTAVATGQAAHAAPATLDVGHPLETYPGANRTIKALEYLKDKSPGVAKLSYRDQVARASLYLRQGAPLLA